MHAGLAHLHQRKFYHRDLKLENVAVSEGQVVKLIDFGSSTSVAAGTTHGSTYMEARTPEISLSQKAHTRAPEVVLGQSVKGTPEEQEKVRRTCIIPAARCVGQNRPIRTNPRAALNNRSLMCGVSASFCSGWCSVTRRSARTLTTRQRSINCVHTSSAHH